MNHDRALFYVQKYSLCELGIPQLCLHVFVPDGVPCVIVRTKNISIMIMPIENRKRENIVQSLF